MRPLKADCDPDHRATSYEERAASDSTAPSSELGARSSSATPEFELLRACAAVQLTAERVRQIRDLAGGIDWEEFFRLADHHGVLPLAARNLLANVGDLPEQVTRSLHTAYENNTRRNLWFAAELTRIADQFERRMLRAVPYKGLLLAELAYGDLALRNFSDLDFLIAAADFEPAKQALAELGYRPSTAYTPGTERLWLRIGYERAFDVPAGKYLVELQWRLLPHFYAVDLATEELLGRSLTAVVSGQTLRTLSPEDLLLTLCLHAAKHLWMRLIWIADIAETVRTQRVDYELVISRARKLGVMRILAVSFWLTENVLEAVLPKPAAEIVAADGQIEVLGQMFEQRLQRSATYDFESSEYFRLVLRLREQRLDRWRYLWRLLWTPGKRDLAAVRLPERLFPLYRAVRLGRMIRKAASTLLT